MVKKIDRKMDVEPKAIEKLMDIRVQSSTTRPQGIGGLLFFLVYAMQPQVILEFGTCRGYTAICMALALPEGGKIWTVDVLPHRINVAKEEVQRLGLSDKIEFIYKRSIKLQWNMPIDLLYIDGDHTYENVHREFLKFSPFVNPDGLIIFHDSSRHHCTGVRKVIEDDVRDDWDVVHIERHPGLSICQKKRDKLSMSFNLFTKKWTYGTYQEMMQHLITDQEGENEFYRDIQQAQKIQEQS